MNEARRETIRGLIRMLESAQEEVHAIWVEEERAFEDRSPASQETESGNVSEEATQHLEQAAEDIENAIEQMQFAIGDATFPDIPLPPSTFKRRV